MKTKPNIFFTLTFVLSLSVSAFAQELWLTKSYVRWNAKEVERMLYASPWTQSRKIRVQTGGRINAVAGSVVGNVSLAPTIDNSIDTGSISPSIDYTFTLRLRSAVPIRQAIARRDELKKKISTRRNSRSLKPDRKDCSNVRLAGKITF